MLSIHKQLISSIAFSTALIKPFNFFQSSKSTFSMQASSNPSTINHLKTYLQSVRPPLPANPHFIIGNEAADVDSVVSAICLAYHWKNQSPSPIPIINIPSNELHLRKDVILTLQQVQVEKEDLIFIDQIDSIWKNDISCSVTLVDHNYPATHQQQFSKFIHAIVDHHVDEGYFKHINPRIITTVASCSTLIWELGKTNWDKNCSKLLLSAIMLDSANLSSVSGKTTQQDIQAVNDLLKTTKMKKKDSIQLHQQLKSARKDTKHMSFYDLLRKDAKVFQGNQKRVLISSINCDLNELSQRVKQKDNNNMEMILEKYRNEKQVDCMIVMGLGEENGQFCRQIGIVKGPIGEMILTRLKQESILQLVDINYNGNMWWMWQRNSKASRKLVAPIVQQALESYSYNEMNSASNV